ncbi:MAG: hypothetical protein NTW29_07780 [Bacteroidetes bacterium]|nr:hypothetical protein [Bacteroidota bacterium]
MQRKHIIIFGFILLLLTSGFVALRTTASVTVEESTCCKKINNEFVEEPKKADNLAPENLSQQFISIMATMH